MVDERQTILQDIADVIREKDGTTETMTFREMPDRIRAIPIGGDGGLSTYIKGDGPLTVSESDMEGVTELRNYTFHRYPREISIDLSEIKVLGENCLYFAILTITNLYLPKLEKLDSSCLDYSNVRTIRFGENYKYNYVTGLRYIRTLESVIIDEPTNVSTSFYMELQNYAFALNSTSDSNIYVTFDFPSVLRVIGTFAFKSRKIESMRFRRAIPPVLNSNSFQSATVRKIIVPRGSLSAYQTATNWAIFADIMEEATE